MSDVSDAPLADLDPFDLFDAEAARLNDFFSSLDQDGWARPSRCEGWSVRDVLAHLAGEELYNHACLDGEVGGLFEMLDREGVSGYDEFNEWCVRQRRDLPVGEVLEEWREKNGETRRRMRELGRHAMLETSVGPYPVGLQTFHYASEYATHADDVGAPVADEEEADRIHWRVRVGLFVLGEQGAKARIEPTAEGLLVYGVGSEAVLSRQEFVEATVGRLPGDHRLPAEIRTALRVLA
ncbi:maleylpyruvate isomerase family mycothiol-dependent enzyme [Thermopolyspora sp. NPDC052614]|uniref:maleylpyruvate isomerase family mycothiol-dependent enzyme n=1 Tax=Thermopolyspora sp. NPDC052614 TaxID=3155682 RepID=UPI0034407431